MAKTNKQYLEETLNDEQQEWFDAVVAEHHNKCRLLEEKLTDANDTIERRDEAIGELEDREFEGLEITTPIGTICYETVGSLDLVRLMEAVARVIEEQGPTELLRHLEGTFAV